MTPTLLTLVEGVLRRPRAVVAATVLLVVAMLPGLARIETDNAPEIFFRQDAAELETYHELRRLFGSDRGLRLVAGGSGLWTEAGLAAWGRVESEIRRLPGVASVAGPAEVEERSLAGWPPADPAAFRERLLTDPLARELGWIDSGGELLTALLVIDPEDLDEQAALLAEVRSIVAGAAAGVDDGGLEVDMVGLPQLSLALDRSTWEISARFFPLLILFAAGLLVIAFRDLRSIVVCLGFVGVTEATALGLMGHLGVQLNLVMVILPPLLFVISLATAVHLLVRCHDFEDAGCDALHAVRETYRDKVWAVVWTGLTTLVGFGSLMVSDVAPVRDLGFWSAVGIALLVALSLTFLPALLAIWPARRRDRPIETLTRGLGRRWAGFATRNRRWLFAAVLALLAVGLAGFGRLRVESNALHYLSESHPVRRDIEALTARGLGPAGLELVLWLPADAAPVRSPEQLVRLARLEEALRRAPQVTGVVGVPDLVAAVERRAGPLVATLPGGAIALVPDDLLASFLPATGGGREVTRLTLFLPVVGLDGLTAVEESVAAAVAEHFPEATATLTGQLSLLVNTQKRLLSSLGASLALTLFFVSLILWTLLRSVRLTFLALIPNLWPVVGVIAVMAWGDLPLDTATVMVGSILLGLAVDDTIHTLNHFRELAPELGALEAVAGTLEKTAAAYLLTAAILAAGFGVCAFSDFEPTSRFGLLAALGVLLALVGDVLFLPALLSVTPEGAMEKMPRPAGHGRAG